MDEKSDPKEKTVLIVDDDETVCTFLKVLLEKEGFKIEIASNGEFAIKVVESQKVDLVILDWMMPVLSGFEVLRMLQIGEYCDIPVIIITARVADRNTIEMIKQEMNVVEFMTKPIKHALFLNRIHQILNTLSPEERKIKEQIRNSSGSNLYTI